LLTKLTPANRFAAFFADAVVPPSAAVTVTAAIAAPASARTASRALLLIELLSSPPVGLAEDRRPPASDGKPVVRKL